MNRGLISLLLLLVSASADAATDLEAFGYGRNAWTGANPLPVMIVMLEFEDRKFKPHQTPQYYREYVFGVAGIDGPALSVNDWFKTVSRGTFSLAEVGVFKTDYPDFPETTGDESRYLCAASRRRPPAGSDDEARNRLISRRTRAELTSAPDENEVAAFQVAYPFDCAAWYWDSRRSSWIYDDSAALRRVLQMVVSENEVDLSRYDLNGDGIISGNEMLFMVITPGGGIQADRAPYSAYGITRQFMAQLRIPNGVSESSTGDFTFERYRLMIGVGAEAGFGTILHEFLHYITETEDIYKSSAQEACRNNKFTVTSCTVTPWRIFDFETFYLDPYYRMVAGWEAPEIVDLSTGENRCLKLAPRSYFGSGIEGVPHSILLMDGANSRVDGKEFFMMEYVKNLGDTYDGSYPLAGALRAARTGVTHVRSALRLNGVAVWHVDVDDSGGIYEVKRFDGHVGDDYTLHIVTSDENRLLVDSISEIAYMTWFASWGLSSSDGGVNPVVSYDTLYKPGLPYMLQLPWVDLQDTDGDGIKEPVYTAGGAFGFRPIAEDGRGFAYVAVGNDSTVCDSEIPQDELILLEDRVDNGVRILRWRNPLYGYTFGVMISPAKPSAGDTVDVKVYSGLDSGYLRPSVSTTLQLQHRTKRFNGAIVREVPEGDGDLVTLRFPQIDPTTGLGNFGPDYQRSIQLTSSAVGYELEIVVRRHPVREAHTFPHPLQTIAMDVPNAEYEAFRRMIQPDYSDELTAPDIPMEAVEPAPALPLPELLGPEDGAILATIDEAVFRWQSNLGASAEGVRFRLCIAPEGGSFDCRLVNPPPTAGAGLTAVGAGSLLLLAGIGFATGSRRRWLIVLLVLGTGLVVNGCGGGGGGSNPAGAAPDVVVEVQETVTGLDRGRYRWYVEVEDKAGNVSSSPVRQFEIR